MVIAPRHRNDIPCGRMSQKQSRINPFDIDFLNHAVIRNSIRKLFQFSAVSGNRLNLKAILLSKLFHHRGKRMTVGAFMLKEKEQLLCQV